MPDFKYYNHLGFHNPYFKRSPNNDKLIINEHFDVILKELDKKVIDFTAAVEILNRGYAFGDRTIVQGISKTPWMAKPNLSFTDWEYFSLPTHAEIFMEVDEICQKFYQLLKEELIQYIGDHKRIGILLTGGMDSRIAACVLNDLLKSGIIQNRSVLALTWGSEISRDVVYAKEISDILNWEWKHLSVDKNQLERNFEITVDIGCEYTPIHLHAMSKVAELVEELDCVIAGSFGDSIGRGEYSGIKVSDLNSLDSKIFSLAGILRPDYKNFIWNDVQGDLSFYHEKFPQPRSYQLYEQDQQIHYMRRMLNSCMSIIDSHIPLYQIFSSPKVFGFIWSLHPSLRNDEIYKRILENNNKDLLNIPWARTGLRFPLKEGIPDKFSKKHHDYGEMIRKDFLESIRVRIHDFNLRKSNMFNINNINRLIKYCKERPIPNSFYYEERLLWLAALSECIYKNKIETNLDPIPISFKSRIINESEYNLKYFYKRYFR